MTTLFTGDSKILLTEEGADLDFKGGQPLMDKGLSNPVLISLFSTDWFMNPLLPENERLSSKVEEYANKPITVDNLNKIRESAINALQWMVTENIASEIDARVYNNTGSQIQLVVLIKPPTGNVQALLATKHGVNWICQFKEI